MSATEANPVVPANPPLLSITTLAEMLEWYRVNLCCKELVDPRGQRVTFAETDFIHLIKLTDKYGKEPRNRAMAIEQIRSGRIMLKPRNIDIQRASELTWARHIVESPDLIVPNWQVLGLANPGDAYIKTFGTDEGPQKRVLICGHAGMKRWAVTIFPREHIAASQVAHVLWP